MRIGPPLAPLLAAALLPGALAAQPRPLSGVFQISQPFTPADPDLRRSLFEPTATALSTGGFAVAWASLDLLGFATQSSGVDGRLVSFAGQPGADFRGDHSTDTTFGSGCPALAATADGGFRLAHLELVEPNSIVETWGFGPGATPVAQFHNVGNAGDTDDDQCPSIATGASGRWVVGWPRTHPGGTTSTVFFVRAFDPAGPPLAPPLALDTALPDFFTDVPPAVGIDRLGRLLAIWRGGSTPGLFARRFAADGTPLGAPFPIVTSYADGPFLAMAPDGGFTVIYTKPAPAGKPHALVLRRFAADDSPVGTPVSPGEIAPVPVGTSAGFPNVSADRYGNFALSWLDAAGHNQVRIFDRSLAAHGGFSPALPPPDPFTLAEPSAVALADSGRLLVAWVDGSRMRGQLWQALREASLCVYRGNQFLCDAAAGGQASFAFGFGLGPPADAPLLADVDGDGRADPCVHRGNRFLCDTARDGGTAEVRIAFGQPGDTPLLGDVDGDGRADACVHRGNRFLCDTAHNGGNPEVTIAFGLAGDVALLGDVDGDRRADPCVYRGGLFLCDTAHDGVLAEVRLDLRPALGGRTDGVPLLGDVDGDGRADACLLRDGTLTCGLFAKTGGTPQLVVTQPAPYVQPGDVPLLGYIGPR